ncbi:hypothetical protein CH375_09060 [Leptospira ellisii]|nr:hypothetical protein CH375_09060 [Leptospira ellisii]
MRFSFGTFRFLKSNSVRFHSIGFVFFVKLECFRENESFLWEIERFRFLLILFRPFHPVDFCDRMEFFVVML